MSSIELQRILHQKWEELGFTLSAEARITNRTFRLIQRLFSQIQRIMDRKHLARITEEVVQAAREYKTQAYIRKAIRQAEYAQVGSGIWSAVLPTLGLRTTGESREDAEQNLLIMITAYVLGAAPESLMLTARESLVVAEAIVHPPAANAYLLRAAQEYREFMGL